jgi:hypothetical protein
MAGPNSLTASSFQRSGSDALVVALVLWTQNERYRSSRLLAGAQVACLATHVWIYLQVFLFMDWGPSLAGIGLAAWLFFELMDLQRGPPKT